MIDFAKHWQGLSFRLFVAKPAWVWLVEHQVFGEDWIREVPGLEYGCANQCSEVCEAQQKSNCVLKMSEIVPGHLYLVLGSLL